MPLVGVGSVFVQVLQTVYTRYFIKKTGIHKYIRNDTSNKALFAQSSK